ncbi:MAG: hypothetical protein U5R06_08595 [candidate division KSB1 bacterium]|nr:hypothetical protein [candidate division KSB1 bacterium]
MPDDLDAYSGFGVAGAIYTDYPIIGADDENGNDAGSACTYPLAPRLPVGLSAVLSEQAVVLEWLESAESDLSHYHVY